MSVWPCRPACHADAPVPEAERDSKQLVRKPVHLLLHRTMAKLAHFGLLQSCTHASRAISTLAGFAPQRTLDILAAWGLAGPRGGGAQTRGCSAAPLHSKMLAVLRALQRMLPRPATCQVELKGYCMATQLGPGTIWFGPTVRCSLAKRKGGVFSLLPSIHEQPAKGKLCRHDSNLLCPPLVEKAGQVCTISRSTEEKYF